MVVIRPLDRRLYFLTKLAAQIRTPWKIGAAIDTFKHEILQIVSFWFVSISSTPRCANGIEALWQVKNERWTASAADIINFGYVWHVGANRYGMESSHQSKSIFILN